MNQMWQRVDWDLDERSVNIEVTPSMIAKTMFFYVQTVGHFYSKPNYSTEREHLNSFLLGFTAAGTGYLKYNGKNHLLKPGSVFLIDCQQYQYYETDKLEPWELIWVHFNGGTSRSYYEQIMQNSGTVLQMGTKTMIAESILEIIRMHQHKDTRTDVISSKLIVDMLTELMLHSIGRTTDLRQPYIPAYILEMMNLMERQCADKITLDLLSAQFAISKYHLVREFKTYTGYSPIEYLINIRLSISKDMLKHSNSTIGEIAEQVGFESTSHFIATFRRQEEITPLAFRKAWRGL